MTSSALPDAVAEKILQRIERGWLLIDECRCDHSDAVDLVFRRVGSYEPQRVRITSSR